jgi:hypothetical protein
MTYSKEDLDRYKYYYKEMADLRKRYPNSLPLRNGMAHIEKVCGLPQVTTSVDPIAEIDKATEAVKKQMLQ